MALVVQHNLPSLNAQNQLRINLSNNQKASEKLSSGYRINRAGDDAAGLAISEKMRGQIRGLDQAVRNSQDGISLIQTAEGGLQETHSILQRVRELAVQSANGTYEDGKTDGTKVSVDRDSIQDEVNALAAEIDRIAQSTKFNGKALLDGAISTNALSFQVGANGNDFEQVELSVDALASGDLFGTTGAIANTAAAKYGDADGKSISVDVGAAAGGGVTGYSLNVSTQGAAKGVLETIDKAINTVSTNRGKLGALQNRLEHTINNLTTTSENLTAAESRIRDTDMAKEIATYTKSNILQQAAQAMLAQANVQPQSVLQLLG